MSKFNCILAYILFSIVFASQIQAQDGDKDRQSVAVTVYNNDLGVVRDVRRFDIKSGISDVKMRDVPTRIDPTTVKITDIDHPKDLEVIEQNYEYDLVSQEKLLSKYIDKTITATDDKGIKTEGTLLAVENDKLTLLTATGIVMLPNLARYTMSVPELPGGPDNEANPRLEAPIRQIAHERTARSALPNRRPHMARRIHRRSRR